MKLRLFVCIFVTILVVTSSFNNIALSQDQRPPVITFEEPFITNPSFISENVDFTASVDTYVGVRELSIMLNDVLVASKSNSNKITYRWHGEYGRNVLRVIAIDYNGISADKEVEVVIKPAKPLNGYDDIYKLKMIVFNMEYMEYENSACFLKNAMSSGNELSFDEGSELSEKIKASKAYIMLVENKMSDAINQGQTSFDVSQVINFDDSEGDYDLWFALHGVKIHAQGRLDSGVWKIESTILDRYDFHKKEGNDFVSQINNIAFNAQEKGDIKPFDITIKIFDIR